MNNILLTGFEAFSDWEVNPTAVSATAIDGMTISTGSSSFNIVGAIIPLQYKQIKPELSSLTNKYQPKAIIMSGQAGGNKIRLEKNAVNRAKSSVPYNCGTITSGQILEETGADMLKSSLPLERYYESLKLHDIPVKYSDSAGLFGCNQVFYHARFLFPGIPAGFIHVPLLPEQDGKHSMDQTTITKGLQLICEETAYFLSES